MYCGFLICKCYSLSRVWLFVIPWAVAHQAPQSMEFSRQEYWSRLPFPSAGDLPDPGIEPRSPALQADSTIWAIREGQNTKCVPNTKILFSILARKYFTLRWEFLHKRVTYAVDSNNTPHFWTAYYVSGTVLYTECELYHSLPPTSLWLLTPFYSEKMEAQRE